MLGRYILSSDRTVAANGLKLLQQMISVASPYMDSDGWNLVVGTIITICGDDPLHWLLDDGAFLCFNPDDRCLASVSNDAGKP